MYFDPFGIGTAIAHGLRMLLHGQRGSGRTTALLAMVKEDDIVVTALRPQAIHMERLLRDAGFKDVRVIVVDPRSLSDIEERLKGTRRRVLFCHSVFEAYYSYCHDRAMSDMESYREWLDQQHESDQRERMGRVRNPGTQIDGGRNDR